MYENKKGTRKNRKGSNNRTRKQPSVASAVKTYVNKAIMRAEESRKIDVSIPINSVGTNAAFAVSISPVISQGDNEGQRSGLKCNLTGARFEMLLSTQVSAVNEIQYKYYLVNYVDAINPLAAAAVYPLVLDPNTFLPAQYDYHSLRNPDNLKSFKIVAQGRGKLSGDSIASQTSYSQISRNLKLNLLQKYPSDLISSTIMNYLYLIVVTDTGDTAVSSGLSVRASMRYWFKDA